MEQLNLAGERKRQWEVINIKQFVRLPVQVIAAEQIVLSFKQLWPVFGLSVTSVGGDDEDDTSQEVVPFANTGVPAVWSRGITGKGVVIGVTDVGINVTLPDLSSNIASEYSYNFITNTGDVTPEFNENYPESYIISDHGSNCAGLISALRNGECGDGVAYGAKIAGLKIFRVDIRNMGYHQLSSFSDAHAAAGLSHASQHIDIYSNSWASTRNFDPNHFGQASQQALYDGISLGRQGKGSIYVFSVGALADGYSNSPYTVTVNEVDTKGQARPDSSLCACTLTSTYGQESVDGATLKTVSSYRKYHCTSDFRGRSVSTAITSGIIGLVLEANKNLTWRDMQHLLVEASDSSKSLNPSEYRSNGAGKLFHYKLGFGILNADRMVELAQNWTHVEEQTCETKTMNVLQCNAVKNQYQCSANVHITSDGHYDRIEHVVVELSYNTPSEQRTEIVLRSPSHTESILMDMAQSDAANTERRDIKLLSVHFWGESAHGIWTLVLAYHPHHGPNLPQLHGAKITICGTGITETAQSAMSTKTTEQGMGSTEHSLTVRSITEHTVGMKDSTSITSSTDGNGKSTVLSYSNASPDSRVIENDEFDHGNFLGWAIAIILLIAFGFAIVGLAGYKHRARIQHTRVWKAIFTRFFWRSCGSSTNGMREDSVTYQKLTKTESVMTIPSVGTTDITSSNDKNVHTMQCDEMDETEDAISVPFVKDSNMDETEDSISVPFVKDSNMNETEDSISMPFIKDSNMDETEDSISVPFVNSNKHLIP